MWPCRSRGRPGSGAPRRRAPPPASPIRPDGPSAASRRPRRPWPRRLSIPASAGTAYAGAGRRDLHEVVPPRGRRGSLPERRGVGASSPAARGRRRWEGRDEDLRMTAREPRWSGAANLSSDARKRQGRRLTSPCRRRSFSLTADQSLSPDARMPDPLSLNVQHLKASETVAISNEAKRRKAAGEDVLRSRRRRAGLRHAVAGGPGGDPGDPEGHDPVSGQHRHRRAARVPSPRT